MFAGSDNKDLKSKPVEDKEKEQPVENDLNDIEKRQIELAVLEAHNKFAEGKLEALKNNPEEFNAIEMLENEALVVQSEVEKTPSILMKTLRNKWAVAVGVLSLTAMASQEVHAEKFDFNELFRNLTDVASQSIRESAETQREKERTLQDKIRYEQDAEQERIREKRDVTITSIERGRPGSIQYTRGGETIGVKVDGPVDLDAQIEQQRKQKELLDNQIEIAKKQKELQSILGK